MKYLFLLNYKVEGIKNLSKPITLSFYKKTISKNINTQKYNIKGIYGVNGSGKTGIVTSVEILKNIIIDTDYLNNKIIQQNLNEMINKSLQNLSIEVEFIVKSNNKFMQYEYEVVLSKNKNDKYAITHEKLSSKKATSRNDSKVTVFDISQGKITKLNIIDDAENNCIISEKTMNLLDYSSFCSLYFEKQIYNEIDNNSSYQVDFVYDIFSLFLFGNNIFTYLDLSDDHRNYILLNNMKKSLVQNDEKKELFNHFAKIANDQLNAINIADNFVPKDMYHKFEKTIKRMYEFIHIFKPGLQSIEIEVKEDAEYYACDLITVYDSYKINAEFESTGIKKLIKLYVYLMEMVNGGIVFIDELDSNLHDVYLCALLEYLMNYANGQLCFTTHNVGPMDVLKQNNKSIDFLSGDGTINSWVKCGNYSPSKLYREGMIDGSTFNIGSIDFIKAFGIGEVDE